MQHGASDRDTRRQLHAIDTQRQKAEAVDLLLFVWADEMTRRRHLGQHHRDGLQRLHFFLVVEATRTVLHDQHTQHAAGAQDRHTGQRVIDFLTRFRPVGKLRMALRIVERQRAAMGCNVTHQTFADAQPRAVHGVGIEALGREQLEHFARAQQVDRAHFGDHFVGHHAHDFAQCFLDGTGTRHRVPEPLEEHSRSGQRSRSLHGQTARCLSRMTTKLRSIAQAQARHAIIGRACLEALKRACARMGCL